MKIALPAIDYKKSLLKVESKVVRYRIVLTSLGILVVMATAILRVDSLTDPDINQDRYDEQQQTISKVEFDDTAIKQIQALREADVDVDSNFSGGRNNPFSE